MLKSPKEGFIKSIDTLKLGEIVRNLGAGRISKEDTIDYGVGIIINKNLEIEDNKLKKFVI